MLATIILTISALLQFIAAVLSLRMVRITRQSAAWLCVALAIFLMGIRRSIALGRIIFSDVTHPPDIPAEMVALIISLFMLIGIAWMLKVFREKQPLDKPSYPDEKVSIIVMILFGFLCVFPWLNEILDLPHILFGVQKTPINWQESLIESVIIACLGVFVSAKIIQYIHDRRESEKRIEHLNLVLRAIRNVNQLITTERDSDVLLRQTCQRLVKTRGYVNVWIMLFDESGKVDKTVEAGFGKEFSQMIALVNEGRTPPCWTRALSNPDISVIENPLTDCGDCPLTHTHDGSASMVVRLKHRERTYGIMSISVPKEFATDWEEQSLCLEIANDISLALHNIEQSMHRERMESALKESEKRFRDISMSMADWIWEVDEKGIYKYVSDNVEMVLGYKPDEIVGKTPFDFMPRDEAQKIAEIFKGIVTKKESIVDLENWNLTKNGIRICILTNGLPILDDNGNMRGYRGVDKNITERKQAEEELLASQLRYKKLFTESIVPIFLINPDDKKIVELNPAALKLTKYSSEELVGEHISKIIFEDKAESSELIEKVKEEDVFIQKNKKIITKEGENRIIDAYYSYYFYKDNELIQLVGADITERKRAEERIRQYNIELKRSNQQLERFAYVASHDLQEPLRMISSFTQLLERRYKEQLDQDAKDFINYAVDGANRMQKLINDLLQYSRVTTRGKPFEEVDSFSILGQVIANLQQMIADTNTIITNDDLPVIRADESQLARVFQNLIENAIKFHGEENPHIHISAQDEGNKWQFSISDNGIGIDKQFQDRVFVIFQRLHGKKEYPGTGIGLAICKRIIQRHGGKIWFESEHGKGTTFFFAIPKQGGFHERK